MNNGEIVKDSLKYPLSDWKNFLILGIILVLADITTIKSFNVAISAWSVTLISILFFLEQIIVLFARGYLIRSIKSSLSGEEKLPRFNEWKDMFLDGIKFLIVTMVYMIPVTIIEIYAVFSNLAIGLNPTSNILHTLLGSGIWSVFLILYIFIILPFQLMAIANMANNGSKLGAAFKFREIINEISIIGWGKLIAWYIINLIVIFVLALIGVFIIVKITFSLLQVIEQIVIALLVGAYISLYLARSTALIYK